MALAASSVSRRPPSPLLWEEDPSLADGFRVMYDREVSIEVRESGYDDEQEVGDLQSIRCKVLALTDGDSKHEAVRVELSSEANLFFHFYHTIDDTGFRDLQQRQKLMIDFPDYPNVLIKMLNQCIKEPHSFMAVMYVHPNGTGRLDFVQNMEYKFVELLSVDFLQSPPELIRQQIQFRYNALKAQMNLLEQEYQEVTQLVKLKNPSLLLQIQRSPYRGAAGVGSKSLRGNSTSASRRKHVL